jgi:chitinase
MSRLISARIFAARPTLLAFVGLLGSLLPLSAAHASQPPRPDQPLQIIGYLFPRGQVIQPGQIAAKKLTRINYAFALIENGRVVANDSLDAPNLAALVALKQQNPSLKIVISVGGWLGSAHFSDASLTPDSRRLFVDSAVDLIRHHQLDGLDIDWEFPGQIGAGNRFRPEDKHNFTLLLEDLRRRFDQEQRTLGRPLLLSIAAGADRDWLDHTEMAEVANAVDTVNLMSYDYYEPGEEPTTGNHSPLYKDPADPRHVSTDASVRAFEAAGVPARKIVVGVPFYGHVWQNVPPEHHGLFQPGTRVPNAFATWQTIAGTMLNQGYTRYWDSAASVPYLYSDQQHQFVSYEDPQSLSLKAAYVRQQGLGGIMFWEYNGDPSGTLLSTIYDAFHSNAMHTGAAQ